MQIFSKQMLHTKSPYFKGNAKMVAYIMCYKGSGSSNRFATVLASENGTDWKPIKRFEGLVVDNFTRIEGANTFVCKNKNNSLFVCSHNGTDWFDIPIPSGFDTTTYNFYAVSYGMYYFNNVYYLLLSDTNTTSMWLYKSTDLNSWVQVNITFNTKPSGTYANKYIRTNPVYGGAYLYMLVGNPSTLYRSNNGEHWELLATHGRFYHNGIACNETGFLLAYGEVSSSSVLTQHYSYNYGTTINSNISKNWAFATGPSTTNSLLIKNKTSDGSYQYLKVPASNLNASSVLPTTDHLSGYSKHFDMFYEQAAWTPIYYADKDLNNFTAFDFTKALGVFEKAWVKLVIL